MSQFLEPRRQRTDTRCQQATIGLELGFARTAKTDTALLTLQMCPAPHEATGQVFQLRELDFELAFMATRTLSKNIQYQRIAIEHAPTGQFLEIAFLTGRERMIHQHQISVVGARGLIDFFCFAAAEKVARIGALAPAGDRGHDLSTGSVCQLFELTEVVRTHRSIDTDTYQHGAFAAPRTFKHGSTRPPAHQLADSAPSSLGSITARAGTTVEMACL